MITRTPDLQTYSKAINENQPGINFEQDLIEMDSQFNDNINNLLNEHCHQERKQEISHMVDQAIDECSEGGKLSIVRLLAKIVQHYKEVSHESKMQQKEQQKKLKRSTESNTNQQSGEISWKGWIAASQLGATLLVSLAAGIRFPNPANAEQAKQFMETGNAITQAFGNFLSNRSDASSTIFANKVQIGQSEFSNLGSKLSSAGQSDQAVEDPFRKAQEALSSSARSQ